MTIETIGRCLRLAVMTPNDTHYKICTAALDAGFHVICDKPLTTNLATAVDLAREVKKTGAEFCLTYCYTGYPMVRQARAMVHSGAIGAIRQVHLQFVQGYLAFDEVPPSWRLDPARVGASLILIDIGTHACHLGAYVTGLDLASVCADVGHVVPGRKVDDYASLLLRYSNDARGSMWVTNAAAGAEHGLSFRIFGETGGLEWNQEEPNRLTHRKRALRANQVVIKLGLVHNVDCEICSTSTRRQCGLPCFPGGACGG